VVRGGQHVSLRYRPTYEGDKLNGLLVIATDVTAARERERAETAQREALALFERVAKDRLAVVEFVAEADRIVRAVQAGTETAVDEARLVHTLKGNAGLYGLTTVVEACHTLEEANAEGHVGAAERAALATIWDRVRATAGRLTGERHGQREIADAELAKILRAVAERRPYAEIATMIAALKLEPVKRRFERLAEQATSLARRLGKGEIIVEIDDGNLRNDPDTTGAFWNSLVHVIRNAVDHGIESPEQRAAAGKPALGTITLRAVESDGIATITVGDDGGGVDFAALVRKANVLQLRPNDDTTAAGLLFIDGLSSRDDVTDVSGRGIGMGAARAEAQRLGGDVQVVTGKGQGTQFVFTMPMNRLAPAMAEAV
jgi:two-component system chemotaxis sensor kinase CheA